MTGQGRSAWIQLLVGLRVRDGRRMQRAPRAHDAAAAHEHDAADAQQASDTAFFSLPACHNTRARRGSMPRSIARVRRASACFDVGGRR